MTINTKRKFGDYWFTFSTDSDEEGGVILNPKTSEMGNPSYVEQLAKAIDAFPIIDAYFSVYDLYKCPPGNLTDYPDSLLEDVVLWSNLYGQSNLITEQEKYEVQPYVNDVIREMGYRERRAIKATQKKQPASAGSRNGYVYLIQSPTGAYKIGRTVDPTDRMRTFSVKLPFEVEYVCLISTPDMHTLEANLHRQFAAHRINGEWFKLEAAHVEYIKSLAGQS